MNSIVASMLGRQVQEDVPVPVGVRRQPSTRERQRVQRRTAAAIMGMAEGDDSIIPDDAEETDQVAGPAGFKIDTGASEREQEPTAPMTPDGEGGDSPELIQPKAALVAPDVTPHTLEPIDPSEVPAPKKPEASVNAPPAPPEAQGQAVNPLDVLLGRKTNQAAPPPENVVTAESAQATVNTILKTGVPSDVLQRGKEMPPPTPADPSKIMEAFSKFSHARRA